MKYRGIFQWFSNGVSKRIQDLIGSSFPLYDWFRKPAPSSQPIRSKTNNRMARVFPRFG